MVWRWAALLAEARARAALRRGDRTLDAAHQAVRTEAARSRRWTDRAARWWALHFGRPMPEGDDAAPGPASRLASRPASRLGRP